MATNKETRASIRAKARARREFILEQARQAGEVSDGTIAEAGARNGVNWGVSAQSLKDDAEYFRSSRLPIVRPHRQHKFLYVTEAHFPYEIRKGVHAQGKEAIGQLAADLIRGASQLQGGVKYTQKDIFTLLAQHEHKASHSTTAQSLTRKLKALYGKYDRLCALDSGTTTLSVAEVFGKTGREMLPDPFSSLKALTVVTNSTDIARSLGHPKSSIQVIMLGGRLRKETQAFAGSLAKTCLESWNLHLDISMVGTVGLEVRKQFLDSPNEKELVAFMSDTFEEAETKQALFARSTLRVILMDSSKFLSDAEIPINVGHFAFARAAGVDVDIIITDNKQNAEKEIDDCWNNGVAVLVAAK